ncbi:MAG: hypothetical protein COU47_02120 [Candidatus Niyogibacteria bacterium CG10_big_fil_rev_8_21_14_0_10_46_36]|uniref:Dihydrolipoamide acetyltransferase component of pyruvate dehydrogenase complex n=1 Tax=Candidatus Niyogibacteria bacterium CG10_big_fil_rev_8_21_14_0_10_46_36 TaxID=1974726 RepID=A0A2H0TDB0_9BACT|nr:MAG: hypothetical protein COU47_02120 [Candidatus Niyogibacteria bacterium CG10_big_fil_rev_8_21_14_0_10_46_36]
MNIKVGFLIKELKGAGIYHVEDFRSVKISDVPKKAGDAFKKGDTLFEIESDKENMPLVAPADGTVLSIEYKKGDTWEYGGKEDTPFGEILIPHLAEVEIEGEMASEKQDDMPQKIETEPHAGKQRVTPVAKRIAEEHNVDLCAVEGTGTSGRIMKEDIERVIVGKEHDTKPAEHEKHPEKVLAVPCARSYARVRSIDISQVRGTRPDGTVCLADVKRYEQEQKTDTEQKNEYTIPAPEIRKAIAKMLEYSWKHVPHAGDTLTVHIEHLARFRERHSRFSEKLFGLRLRLDHFFLYYATRLLSSETFSMLNNYWDPEKEEIHILPHVNLGIAVDVGYGLVVPVIHKAETYSFRELAGQVENRIIRAKENRLTRADFLDLTFTVNNPGALGGEEPAMIIPATRMKEKSGIRSTSMIMGLGRMIEAFNGERVMQLTFRFDHRIVDGRLPLEFMGAMRELCEAEDEEDILSSIA